MSLSIEPTVLLDGHPFFSQHVSDRFIPTLSFCRVRTYPLYGVVPVRHTAPRRMRGPSYPTLEAQTSRKDKATTPSGPGVGTIGHQPAPGKLRPLTKNLRIGTYLVTPYTPRPSVRPVPVRRIYERGPSGTLCKWKQLNRSTAHQVTDT